MGKIVVKKAVKRKPGHLYYIDAAGNVCEANMARGGKKKKKAAKKKPAKKKKVVKKKPAKKKKVVKKKKRR